jgi:hypothetical protein
MAEPSSAKCVAAATVFAVALGSAVLRRWARTESPSRVVTATRVGDWFRSNGCCASSQFSGNPLAVTIAKVMIRTFAIEQTNEFLRSSHASASTNM